ncbi:Tpr-like protein [Theileria parva strain Muguga]|uniref:Uncharacterized protein n=1 Tax=Theileria parva TaxID=5875 RepID=Q4N4S6_THEPA|nr:Tpr-like protein [Theileria parva strain Muguga]EAN32847.1 Tpr-like protein [Theileria parva strain Muguga]|eukprot:XP_765130.1 hypothetical protein [Theileria parva strain Muguga]
MEKAQTLYEKADTLANTTESALAQLKSPAGNLKNAAKGSGSLYEKAKDLAKDIGNDGKAGDVITAFEDVRTKYNELTGNLNYNTYKDNEKVKAVDDAYKSLKDVYDTILNVKKANLLKAQVGDGNADQKIWSKAKDLYTKANLLATAVSSNNELKDPVDALATAVGADDNNGLRKALSELNSDTDTNKADFVKKAMEVISNYNSVNNAYNAVKAKQQEYTAALTTSESAKYTQVTSNFTQLERAYNLANCKAITPILDKLWIRYSSITCTWSNLKFYSIYRHTGTLPPSTQHIHHTYNTIII